MALIDGLEAYYKFDVDSASQVDSTGNGNSLTVTNAVFTASGKVNGGYVFNGSNTKIVADSNTYLDITTSDFSINIWVNLDTATSNRALIDKRVVNSPFNGYTIYYNGTDNVIRFGMSDGTYTDTDPPTFDLEGTGWHMITVVVDRGTNVKWYVDADIKATSTAYNARTGSLTNDQLVKFGVDRTSTAAWLDGTMDEPSFWTRIITQSEITELYNSGSGFQYPFAVTPVAAFSADDVDVLTGATIVFTDSSSNTPTSWSWIFESGDPTTSTDQNPSVEYTTAGLFDVSLEATNDAGSDTESKVEYITVTVDENYVEAKRKELKTNWPFTEGLTARTTKQTGRVMNLVPQTSLVPKRLKVGFR